MRCMRALPIFQLMPAVGSRKLPVATPLLGGRPGKNERPHPITSPHAGSPGGRTDLEVGAIRSCAWVRSQLAIRGE